MTQFKIQAGFVLAPRIAHGGDDIACPDTVADPGGVCAQRGQQPGQFPVGEAGGQPLSGLLARIPKV